MMTPEEMITYDQIVEYAGISPKYIDFIYAELNTDWNEVFDVVIALHTNYETFIDWYVTEVMEDYGEFIEDMEAAFNAAA